MAGSPEDQAGRAAGHDQQRQQAGEQKRRDDDTAEQGTRAPALASVELPKGGGAIRGLGEKFSADLSTGTGTMTIPVPVPPGRSDFKPELVLAYDSASGNGPFGFGWSVALPSVTRKTENGLPRYLDADESDVFVLSGADDLVPALQPDGDANGRWSRMTLDRPAHAPDHRIDRYRPRIERGFDRIERWTRLTDGDVHWRTVTRDNVTSVFGTTSATRIEDPAPMADGRRRVFSWLIAASWDDRGNAVSYEYKAEDGVDVDIHRVEEAGRDDIARAANRYPKRIRYGNRVSRLVQPDLDAAEWLFEVVFDYGEHDPSAPTPADTGDWLCRHDPFSSYRAGFEVRTYRLCQRIMSFHHFRGEEGVGADCLVRSLDLTYRSLRGVAEDERRGEPLGAFLASARQRSYRRSSAGYTSRALPAVEVFYSLPTLHEEVHDLDPTTVASLPAGVTPSGLQWADVDGEGIPGILVGQAGTWAYARNLGAGRLGPLTPLPSVPSNASSGPPRLVDLEGDGQLDAISLDPHRPGFHERAGDRWSDFEAFASLPRIDWDQPNLRLVDLDGDGRADALITTDDRYVWFPSLGEGGYGEGRDMPVATDEGSGPRLVFGDRDQSVYLADMSGDGLSDLVRIRNGETCYWPNLGYGRWGGRVTMGSSPRFDHDDLFDQSRVRLFDVDGSGVTDILYIGGAGIDIYANQAGNSFAAGYRLTRLPELDDTTSVSTVDLLGTGTACLVWSSGRAGDEQRSVRYIDLLGSRKPHLLVGTKNNLGSETYVTYAPSTVFYLSDRAEGRPWATRLSFPVHVVERVEVHDRVSRNRFSSRYAYHEGYFDPTDREFRGFAMTEQWDAADFAVLGPSDDVATNLDGVHELPPTRTVTWSHTGAPDAAAEALAEGLGFDDGAPPLPRSIVAAGIRLPDGTLAAHVVTPEERREAVRALKGSVVRQEVYAIDGSPAEGRPHSVTMSTYAVDLLQPEASNRHAVCIVHARETLTAHHERTSPPDPRVTHDVVLARDGFGNVLRSAVVAYPRRHELPAALADGSTLPQLALDAVRRGQRRIWATLTENMFTNLVDGATSYRAPMAAESTLYELVGLDADGTPTAPGTRLTFAQIEAKEATASDGAHDVPPEAVGGASAGTAPGRRLAKRSRRLYRADDLTGPLPLGSMQSAGLLSSEYELALTAGLIASHLTLSTGGGAQPVMADPAPVLDEGGYVPGSELAGAGLFPTAGPGEWWAPTPRTAYSPTVGDAPATELAHARAHFFMPVRLQDQFGNVSTVRHDDYSLVPLEARDAVGNRVTAGTRSGPDGATVTPRIDYRVLRPSLLTDANGNATAAAFDTMGLMVGVALMGKGSTPEGDGLDDFQADLDDATVAAFLADPLAEPLSLLGSATTRYVYDIGAYQRTQDSAAPQPSVVCTMTREVHRSEAPQSPVAPSFLYVDGFSREIQRKERAEPGPLLPGGPVTSPRWIGTGWTVFDNKGNPVRRFEPFFSASHGFEFDRRIGVSQVTFYDALGRAVTNLYADGSWDKTVQGPWHQETWDRNDTVLLDPAADPNVGGYVSRFVAALQAAEGWLTWHGRRIGGALGPDAQAAAALASLHAGTPVRSYLDGLGRAFAAVDRCRTRRPSAVVEEWYVARVELDVEDRELAVVDARGLSAVAQWFDLRGDRLRLATADSGERVGLADVVGAALRSWDSRGHVVRTTYDAAHRPVESFVTPPGGTEQLRERRVYGEAAPNATDANLRGQLHHHFDGAGVLTTEAYDFKGKATVVTRRFAAAHAGPADWSMLAARTDVEVISGFPSGQLSRDSFTTVTTFDAMKRPVLVETTDGSRVRSVRNEANLVERVEVQVRGAGTWTAFMTGAEYNAKGNRVVTGLGNGVRREQLFDPETDRVVGLRSVEAQRVLQDRTHVYDAVGNVVAIRDAHQPTVFYSNAVVAPHADYEYDSLYRLTAATGREHIGLAASPAATWDDTGRTGKAHPEDGQAMRRYAETYTYDAGGNIVELSHRASGDDWTRTYAYSASSNRLASTAVGAGPAETFSYDVNGNTTSMPHVGLSWDVGDRLVLVDRGGGGRIHYHYDGNGQRVRTVVERQNGTRASERLYVSGVEVFRTFDGTGSTVELERETLHVNDETHRLASVETRTVGSDPSPGQLTRYQIDDHLGSTGIELDDVARIITHEEFYPWGATSFLAGSAQTQVPKRYRFSGKERDEGTGFSYHGARYYAPWLGRWSSCDREVHADGPNLYAYTRNNPVAYVDPDGREARLIVDATTRTVTVQTTVHLYDTTGQSRQDLWATAQQAVDMWNKPTVATQAQVEAARAAGTAIPNAGLSQVINGQQWTLRFDVQFQIHAAQNAPVRYTPSAANQVASVYTVDTARVAADGIRTGDNVFTLTRPPSGGTAGGVTAHATVPGNPTSVTNMAGLVYGGSLTNAGDRETVARRLAHEIGHGLGLDERYPPIGSFYAGYRYDIMSAEVPATRNDPRVLDPSHVADFLTVGEQLSRGGLNRGGVFTWLLSGHIDDTRGGYLGVANPDYAAAQTAAQGAAVTRTRSNTIAREVNDAFPGTPLENFLPHINTGFVGQGAIPANNPQPAQRRRRP